ncbi:MAG: PAS domain-containing protein [Planctomycetota bacterium]|nr:PAS domain-containing protein [Planctomycetota bacterium]
MSIAAWRILIVDDSPDDRGEIRRLLLTGSDRTYEFVEAETAAEGIRLTRAMLAQSSSNPAALSANTNRMLGGTESFTAAAGGVHVAESDGDNPRLIVILDYWLPDMRCEEVLDALRGDDGLCVAPLVVLTGSPEREMGTGLLRAGAMDYMCKSWMVAQSLTRAIENAVERHAMQRELAIRHRFISEITSLAPGIVYVYDLDARRARYMSGQAFAALGFDPRSTDSGSPDVQNGQSRYLIHPEDAPGVERHFARLRTAKDGEAHEIEYRMRHRDGSWRWFRSRDVVFERDAAGRPCALLGIATDMTDAKRTEQSTRENESILRGFYDSCPFLMGVAELDGDEIIPIHGNAAVAAFLRVQSSKIGSTSARNLCRDSKVHDLWVQHYRRAELEKQPVSFEYEHPREGGAVRLTATVSYVGLSASGRPRFSFLVQDITDARRSEERLALARDAASLGIHDWNVVTGEIDWDRRVRELWGARAEETITYDLFMASLHPDDRERTAKAVERALDPQGDGNYAADYRVTSAIDGVERWIEATGRVTFVDGRPLRLVGTVQDVSDRKHAEAAVRASEDRLQLALATGQAGTWDLDLSTGRLVWSESHFTLMGLEPTPDRVVPDGTWERLVHPDDIALVWERWAEAERERRNFESEHRMKHAKTGETIWVRAAGSFSFDDSGKAKRFVGVFFDITKQREAEEKLRESERLLRAVIESTTDLVWVKNQRGRFTLANQATIDLLGGPSMFEKDLAELVPDAEQRRVIEENDARIQRRGTPELVEEHFGPPEAVKIFQTVKAPLRDADGAVAGILGVSRDVTAARKAEEAHRDRERWWRLALEAAEMGAWTYDPIADRVGCDERSRRLMQVGDAELVDFRLWLSRVHPDDRERVEREAAMAMTSEGDGRYSTEYRVAIDDDPAPSAGATDIAKQAFRWIAASAQVTFDAGRRAIRWHGTVQDVTQRRDAERALAQAADALALERERLSIALRAGGLGVYEWTPQDGSVWWSPETYAVFGVGADFKPSIASFTNLVHPDDRGELWRKTEESVRDRGPFVHEYRIRRPDGQERWIFNRSHVVIDEHGNLERVTGVAGDITDRKKTEQTIRDSEARLRTFFQAPAVGTLHGHIDGRIFSCNDEFLRIIGRTRESFDREGVLWDSITPAEWLGVDASAIAEARQRGACTPYEKQYLRPDGSRVWVLLSYTLLAPLREESMALIIDISDRKRAEQELRETESRFRIMADGLPLPVWVHDEHGQQEFVNATFCRFFGVSREEMRGGRWRAMFHPDDEEAYTSEFDLCVKEHRAFHASARVRAADGSWRWIDSWGEPRFDADGTFRGFIGASADVTEQRRAEEELRLHREHLERLVRERTAELETSYQKLRLSERMASLGTLAAGLGHDMGNLLMPMRVRLDALESMRLNDSAIREIKGIRSVAGYLQRLASGLRLLAIDPAKAAPSEATEMRSWWSEAEPILRNVLPRGITLHGEPIDDQCWVGAPRTALMQAVFNLVQNAGDAMRDRGHGRVTIRVSSEPNRVVLSVTDDGPGMNDEVKRRCMEPFFTTKTRDISTGLGLALVYSLVHDVGGSIELSSELGRGTTFKLRLPRVTPPGTGNGESLRARLLIADPRIRAFVGAELRRRNCVIVDTAPTDLIIEDAKGPDADSREHHAAGANSVSSGPTNADGHTLREVLSPVPLVVQLPVRAKVAEINALIQRVFNSTSHPHARSESAGTSTSSRA